MEIDEHIKQQEQQTHADSLEVTLGEPLEFTFVENANVFAQLPVHGVSANPNKNGISDTIVRVQDLWRCMKTRKDLLHLLNVALAGMYGEQSTILTMKQLCGYAYSTIEAKSYTTFQIPKKKKGEFRTIDAPVPMLKYIQRGLNFILQCVYTPHTAAMGFVQHRSVVDNAKVHTGQRLVYNIDLKDFFPSITAGRLYHRLMSKPFSLNEKVASIITDLCCYTNADGKHVLPQGAPTSPTITNIICERLDRKLARLARAYGLKYTRYADDISFSGMGNVFAEDSRFVKSMHNIIEQEEHFIINKDKTRLCHRGMRQEVTGLSVNQQENVSRTYIKQLRTLLHNWEMNGYDKAQEVFAKHYAETNTRNLKNKGTHHVENIIAGKLMYLKMVKGETDCTYKNLFARFKLLLENHTDTKIDKSKFSDDQAQNIPVDEGPKHVTNNETVQSVDIENSDEILSTFSSLEELLNNENE
ncbi:MAG: RNA-directed DNA polymerase [Bacteroidales bacterium]|nr:RNA-directed DNA polymerase [Bacteroidales bacterium]